MCLHKLEFVCVLCRLRARDRESVRCERVCVCVSVSLQQHIVSLLSERTVKARLELIKEKSIEFIQHLKVSHTNTIRIEETEL